MSNTLPKLILTSGEPAGIGPDLVLAAAGDHWDAQLVAVGNEALLAERANMLGLSIELLPYNSTDATQCHQDGYPSSTSRFRACTGHARRPERLPRFGATDMAANLPRVRQAMVTAPVHKAIINDGVPFSGHTGISLLQRGPSCR